MYALIDISNQMLENSAFDHARRIAIADDARLTANARPQGGLSMEIHCPLIPFAVPR